MTISLTRFSKKRGAIFEKTFNFMKPFAHPELIEKSLRNKIFGIFLEQSDYQYHTLTAKIKVTSLPQKHCISVMSHFFSIRNVQNSCLLNASPKINGFCSRVLHVKNLTKEFLLCFFLLFSNGKQRFAVSFKFLN